MPTSALLLLYVSLRICNCLYVRLLISRQLGPRVDMVRSQATLAVPLAFGLDTVRLTPIFVLITNSECRLTNVMRELLCIVRARRPLALLLSAHARAKAVTISIGCIGPHRTDKMAVHHLPQQLTTVTLIPPESSTISGSTIARSVGGAVASTKPDRMCRHHTSASCRDARCLWRLVC